MVAWVAKALIGKLVKIQHGPAAVTPERDLLK